MTHPLVSVFGMEFLSNTERMTAGADGPARPARGGTMTAAMITTPGEALSPHGWCDDEAADQPLQLVRGAAVGPIVDRETLRRVVAVAVAVAALVALVSTVSGRVWPTEPVATGPAVQVVEPGDTVWSLVRESYPEGDIGPIVADVLADRAGSPLRVGEVIEIAVD
ncbi:MAG: hypothetical protein AAGD18_19895 [Actinomycetota bacterium]